MLLLLFDEGGMPCNNYAFHGFAAEMGPVTSADVLQFTKLAWFCRDRQYTKLIRVDVSVTAEGVLLAALSHEAEGFAPYRLDNCTGETLHVR